MEPVCRHSPSDESSVEGTRARRGCCPTPPRTPRRRRQLLRLGRRLPHRTSPWGAVQQQLRLGRRPPRRRSRARQPVSSSSSGGGSGFGLGRLYRGKTHPRLAGFGFVSPPTKLPRHTRPPRQDREWFDSNQNYPRGYLRGLRGYSVAVDPRWRPLAPSAATRSRIDCAAEHFVQAFLMPFPSTFGQPFAAWPAQALSAHTFAHLRGFCGSACGRLADLCCSARMVEAATSAGDASAMAGISPWACSIGSRARRQRIHTANACREFDGGAFTGLPFLTVRPAR